MRKINNIIVHCTATPQDWEIHDILSIFYDDYGWSHPGYHFIIEADGYYENTLDVAKIANGVKGHNHDSVHISYIGGVDEDMKSIDNRTEEQNATLYMLVRDMSMEFPNAKIRGHRDMSPDIDSSGEVEPDEWLKKCPSFDVESWAVNVGLIEKC